MLRVSALLLLLAVLVVASLLLLAVALLWVATLLLLAAVALLLLVSTLLLLLAIALLRLCRIATLLQRKHPLHLLKLPHILVERNTTVAVALHGHKRARIAFAGGGERADDEFEILEIGGIDAVVRRLLLSPHADRGRALCQRWR